MESRIRQGYQLEVSKNLVHRLEGKLVSNCGNSEIELSKNELSAFNRFIVVKGNILNAKIKSEDGIWSTSFSISNFKKDTLRFHNLLRSFAIDKDCSSLSIPINSHSLGNISFNNASHKPDAHPRSTILWGCNSMSLWANLVRSGILAL